MDGDPMPENNKYKATDKLRRTSKAYSPAQHLPWHIKRWKEIGEGQTYADINAADSGYRRLVAENDENYRDNSTSIDRHLDYDIEIRGMIEKISEEK
jgi:hypothetical protein